MADKYYFPLLEEHIKTQGLNKTEFHEQAFKIASEPKARTWANAMSAKKGVSDTYAYKIKRVLETMGAPDSVLNFEKVI